MSKFDEINIEKVQNITREYLAILGINIRQLRKKNKLSQSDVAFYIFSDKSLISELERGVKANITLETILRIGELFEKDINTLLKQQ